MSICGHCVDQCARRQQPCLRSQEGKYPACLIPISSFYFPSPSVGDSLGTPKSLRPGPPLPSTASFGVLPSKVSKASGHHEQPTQMPRTRACVRSKPGKMLWSKHTVKDQCQVRSSWLLDADGTQVAARLAVVLVDRHIVLEELEPVGRL